MIAIEETLPTLPPLFDAIAVKKFVIQFQRSKIPSERLELQNRIILLVTPYARWLVTKDKWVNSFAGYSMDVDELVNQLVEIVPRIITNSKTNGNMCGLFGLSFKNKLINIRAKALNFRKYCGAELPETETEYNAPNRFSNDSLYAEILLRTKELPDIAGAIEPYGDARRALVEHFMTNATLDSTPNYTELTQVLASNYPHLPVRFRDPLIRSTIVLCRSQLYDLQREHLGNDESDLEIVQRLRETEPALWPYLDSLPAETLLRFLRIMRGLTQLVPADFDSP